MNRYFRERFLTILLLLTGLILCLNSSPVSGKTGIKPGPKDKVPHTGEAPEIIKGGQRPETRGMVLFNDWYSVWPGGVSFGEKEGNLSKADIINKGKAHQVDVPTGVRLAVQEAGTTEPVLEADKPWESYLLPISSVLADDSGFKMWYTAVFNLSDKKVIIDDVMAGDIEVTEKLFFLCYAESKDGLNWHKPNLGLYEFNGSTANNIICEETSTDNVFMGKEGNYRRLVSDGDPLPGGQAKKAMYSYSSKDGIHWTLDGPVLDMMCDTQNNGFYDKLYGKYVLYVRYSSGLRRAIAMTDGPEFNTNSLPLPQMVLEPDPQDPVGMDIYTIAYSRYPGYDKIDVGDPSRSSYFMNRDSRGRLNMVRKHDARDMHYMFPSVYHRDRSVIDVQLAVSRDGRQWNRPERKAIISCGSVNDSISTIYAFPGIHTLKSGLWGVMYSASERPHNIGLVSSGENFNNKYYWATWKENRLVALEAESEGGCTVRLYSYTGEPRKELRLNYQTEKFGWVRIELISSNGLHPPTGPEIIDGYSFDDCDPLVGDSLYQTVTWNGSSELPSGFGAVRIRMFRAKLYAIEWE